MTGRVMACSLGCSAGSCKESAAVESRGDGWPWNLAEDSSCACPGTIEAGVDEEEELRWKRRVGVVTLGVVLGFSILGAGAPAFRGFCGVEEFM